MTVVGTANGAAEKHESPVVLTGAEQLPCMPGKRRPVKGDEQ